MSLTRREFLGLSMKGIFIIGAGNALQSFTSNSFALPPLKDVVLRFAIASDGHYGQEGTEYKKLHDQMVDWINDEKRKRGVDFSFINGDLIHNDVKFLPEVKAMWDKLQMPYYVSHGNHDMIDEAGWQNVWKMPLHFDFEKNGNAFLVLNTADDKGKYICPDLDWTKAQLEKYNTHTNLFVFMHITPLEWTKAGNPCPELVKMFNQQKNLKAVFHGHDHDQDDVKENNGKHYFFDSHVAGNWGTDYHGYRIVEILKNGDIVTYQMNGATKQSVNSSKIS